MVRQLLAALASACLVCRTGALDQGCAVTLFDGNNLDGTNATFVIGDYTKTQMVAGGFPDNSVSSLRVVGIRCMATIFDGEQLEPSSWNSNYPEGEYPLLQFQLRGGYDFQGSSLRVWRTSCAVTLFDGPNFETSSYYLSLTAATYTKADLASLSGTTNDDVVSSVRVAGPRCTAIVYEGPTFNANGWSVTLPEGDYTRAMFMARGGVDNATSSIKVQVSECVAGFFDGDNLEESGFHLSFLPGDYQDTAITAYGDGAGTGVASSLRVSGYGCTATAFQTGNLDAGGGWSATFPEGDFPLAGYTAGGAVDNQLNSIRVTYTPSVFALFTDRFSGENESNSIQTFFPASIGDQWTFDSSGLTLMAGDGAHHKAILRSVSFTLPPSTSITLETGAGGMGSPFVTTALRQGAVVERAGAADNFGFLGFGINDFITNTYVVSKRRATASTASEDVVFSTSDLALYANRKVSVDVIDAYTGSLGYLSLTSITIAVACQPITTTDNCQFDVTGCTAVPPGRACLVYCQGPYTGTASAASCPVGNTDPTTPLTWGGMPNCILPCPNPSTMPTGYTGSGDGLTAFCDTAGGYVGTAVKTCTMDSATCTRQVVLSGCTLPGSAVVSGDPITYYGDQRSEFKVPVGGRLTPLLEVPDMRVLASSVKGRGDEQWINCIVVTTPAGKEVVSVTIKEGLFDFNRSLLPLNAFETLHVRMDWLFSEPLTVMPPANEYYIHWHGLRVAFGRARGELTDAPRREMVLIVSKFANVYVASSSAREYYEQPFLAYQYAHLDLIVGDMRNRSSFAGLLPELWGITVPGKSRLALPQAGSGGRFLYE
uniref:Beta/gamma crystallin 'Greek key' domain-containing protein n=1 Tax=Alexandrium monilatum TaxID=311494 RepID=A0A6T1ASK1_9DINO|mmetsp:Transcript_11567/g.36359  ORF Transcript_11567/g.36359 Transcript_11567/m.36359 type:complete len:827 (-) Transcript_11567:182-2662(-)